MKRIVLIGDSIRIGYEATVRSALEGTAEIWTPGKENGGTSRNVLEHLEEWMIQRRPDIVHINAGLHDLRKEFNAPQSAVAIEEYIANLRTILTRMREAGTKVIWALTTPVNEQRHHATKPFDRFEADVTAYNAAATAVCRELCIPTNDLYSLVMAGGRDQLLGRDGVHYTPDGYALLGCAVANVLRAVIELA